RLLVSQGEFEKADRQIDEIPLPQPSFESATVFRQLGEWHALHGRWKDATRRFATLQKLNEPDGWGVATLDLLRLGTALIESGDQEGYAHFRQTAVNRFANTTNAVAAERVIKISLLLPADEQLLGRLEPLAAVAAKPSEPADEHNADAIFFRAWRSVSL